MPYQATDPTKPGAGLYYSRMPGHWLLAQMGKRVLRPGGLELTRQMLEALDIGTNDDVVEFAPGLGVTARATLERRPRSYIGIERNEDAARNVRWYLNGKRWRCLVGRAEKTGLPDASSSVVYGEATLTMQPTQQKAAIVAEAARVLCAGGRYGLHELSLRPNDLPSTIKLEIQMAVSDAIHVGARPLTGRDWRALVAAHGFSIEKQISVPMHLLKPWRLVRDEGLPQALRFLWNMVRTPATCQRIRAMHTTFRRYAEHLSATAIVAVKG